MPQSRIEIYDTPKLQYRVCFHAVRRGYIVTVPALEELAVFGANIKQARLAAATAIEALTEELEANGVPVMRRDPLAVSMTENIERMSASYPAGRSSWSGSIASAPFSPCWPMRRTG